MTAGKDEAKQLDSVTDRVQEREIMDEGKAKNAMSAISVETKATSSKSNSNSKVIVSKDDVAVIVEELECTEDVAMRALREAISERGGMDGKEEDSLEGGRGSALDMALRKLVMAGSIM
mmetsp:Transcript_14789/g.21132  ORF Transcript_14789/g.21132 Transcript_14789/m.21132 type:complete len:119 (+) Transcript_14789:139-495(+)|eukprot:CAMPEP_0184870402 /NCGR_PEP_ID=MMETSP0580-20130426/37297_1 /TAXON_ID=1118495 /ORGANISM="Dactyliosolen fragilissimus" /LENGTH=118 /DNA_ID=CAMNT_0027372445 /DNA_START=52 /DNA_END=408 /DNA_ORIENTATION=+